MKMLTLSAAALLSAVPPVPVPVPPALSTTPPPPPAEAPAPAPDPLEAELWAQVRRADSLAAYEIYLRRFSGGPNRGAALEAVHRLQGHPVVHAPPAPPAPGAPPTSRPVQPAGPNALFPAEPCRLLLAAYPPSDEARSYRLLLLDNRPSEYRRYIAQYPGGACAADAARLLERREARRAATVRIPGLGPLPAHRLSRRVIGDGDYPASALRAELSGTVVAAWDVAEDGAVELCRIVSSSGHAVLDGATCAIVMRRMTYDPARDGEGNPARGADTMAVRWMLPAD